MDIAPPKWAWNPPAVQQDIFPSLTLPQVHVSSSEASLTQVPHSHLEGKFFRPVCPVPGPRLCLPIYPFAYHPLLKKHSSNWSHSLLENPSAFTFDSIFFKVFFSPGRGWGGGVWRGREGFFFSNLLQIYFFVVVVAKFRLAGSVKHAGTLGSRRGSILYKGNQAGG